MQRFTVFAGYQQFYVADTGLEPDAPEYWNEQHCQQRHNTLQHITALCPAGDISARIIACGPDEACPAVEHPPEFEVETQIEVPSGRIGIIGWPWDVQVEYQVEPGTYSIFFRGYALDQVESEEDYYVVQIRKK